MAAERADKFREASRAEELRGSSEIVAIMPEIQVCRTTVEWRTCTEEGEPQDVASVSNLR